MEMLGEVQHLCQRRVKSKMTGRSNRGGSQSLGMVDVLAPCNWRYCFHFWKKGAAEMIVARLYLKLLPAGPFGHLFLRFQTKGLQTDGPLSKVQEIWLWVKNRYPKWNPGSGNMDQNLRFPGLILTHTHIYYARVIADPALWLTVVLGSVKQLRESSLSVLAKGRLQPLALGIWVWLNIKQEGLRRFWSMFPLSRVLLWYRFFEPLPYGSNRALDHTRVSTYKMSAWKQRTLRSH